MPAEELDDAEKARRMKESIALDEETRAHKELERAIQQGHIAQAKKLDELRELLVNFKPIEG